MTLSVILMYEVFGVKGVAFLRPLIRGTLVSDCRRRPHAARQGKASIPLERGAWDKVLEGLWEGRRHLYNRNTLNAAARALG